jgi:hypothetical protein
MQLDSKEIWMRLAAQVQASKKEQGCAWNI